MVLFEPLVKRNNVFAGAEFWYSVIHIIEAFSKMIGGSPACRQFRDTARRCNWVMKEHIISRFTFVLCAFHCKKKLQRVC